MGMCFMQINISKRRTVCSSVDLCYIAGVFDSPGFKKLEGPYVVRKFSKALIN